MKTYNITRENASSILGISTRTIDRYIKGGKLSYKKIANKVLLAKEEIASLKDEFALLHQELNTEIIGTNSDENKKFHSHTNISSFEESIDEKIDKFFLIFREKDKMIEEKNKIIFMLQQRIGEVETKLQHMIALPDYNKEKQEILAEKEKLENKIKELKGTLDKEKNKGIIFIGFALIFIILAVFLFLKSQ